MFQEKFNKTYNTEQKNSEEGAGEKDFDQENNIEEIRNKYEELEKWGNVLLGREGWSMAIDPSIPTAGADFKNKILYFGTKCEDIIADSNVEKQDLKRLFIFSHEVMHFAQALEAPEEYLSTFDIAEEKAEEFSQKYGANKQDLQESFKTFFNIFLDIDDNGKVIRRNKRLQKEPGQEATEDLYQKLFSRSDLTNDPLNEQFMYAAIMRIMDQEREVRLSAEVRELLEDKFQYLGKHYKSLIGFIEKEVYSPDIPFEKSLFRIKKILQPQFEDFLKKDLEENNYKNPRKNRKNRGIDDGIGEDTLKDFIEGVLRERESTKEKANNQIKKDFEKRYKKEGFNEKDIREMERVMRNTDNIWPQMIDLWEKFFAVSKSYTDKEEGYFYSGQTFSTKKFVRDLPKFIKDTGSVKPFKRNVVAEEQESWKPKKISLIFTTDLSGSMDNAKRQAVQEAYYCIAKSFIQFQRNQIIKNDESKSPVEGYIRNIGFGSDMQDLLKLTPTEKETRIIDPGNENLDKRMWQSILEIGTLNLKGNDDPSYLFELKNEAEKSKNNLENNQESMVIGTASKPSNLKN